MPGTLPTLGRGRRGVGLVPSGPRCLALICIFDCARRPNHDPDGPTWRNCDRAFAPPWPAPGIF
jgi:hypothetical protein